MSALGQGGLQGGWEIAARKGPLDLFLVRRGQRAKGDPVRVVVKLGGSLLTDLDLLHRMVAQLSAIQGAGHQVIVVHGGGKQIKETLEQLAIPSRFHQGLRVTDARTMRVVQMVLSGWVNKEIVAAFHQARSKSRRVVWRRRRQFCRTQVSTGR